MNGKEHSDAALRSAYRALVEEAELSGGPDADRIWDAVAGSAPVEERRKVVDEMATHPGAAVMWRLARELQDRELHDRELQDDDERAPTAPASRPIPPWRRGRHGTWALAAAAAVAIAVGTWVARPQATGPAQYRAPDLERLRPEMPRDRALDRNRAVLRWSSVEGARYDVRVMTESLAEVVSARALARPEFPLPARSLGALPAGARILWQVTARLPSGAELRSQTFYSVIE